MSAATPRKPNATRRRTLPAVLPREAGAAASVAAAVRASCPSASLSRISSGRSSIFMVRLCGNAHV